MSSPQTTRLLNVNVRRPRQVVERQFRVRQRKNRERERNYVQRVRVIGERNHHDYADETTIWNEERRKGRNNINMYKESKF